MAIAAKFKLLVLYKNMGVAAKFEFLNQVTSKHGGLCHVLYAICQCSVLQDDVRRMHIYIIPQNFKQMTSL